MSFPSGLQEVGAGAYAYLQPDGAWGLNNAGLIVDEEATLLVDTLFDLAFTQRMLDAMSDAVPAAKKIDTVVNTHANGDHCWGNQLLPGANIVASEQAALEMQELPPARVAMLQKAARTLLALGPFGRGLGALGSLVGLTKIGNLVEAAPFVDEIFGQFDFGNIRLVPPTQTFNDEITLKVGDKEVVLWEVGPAHTQGDVMAWVPSEKVVYTGDILFIEAHPIVWAGPIKNWIAAIDRILELNADIVVPGHGPIAERRQVERVGDYLRLLYDETKQRHAAGLSVEEATHDIALDGFSTWSESERMAVNVDTIYRELNGTTSVPDPVELFARMARFQKARQR